MSRPLCYCCFRLPTGKDREQPFALEIPDLTIHDDPTGTRSRFQLCGCCIIFVCEEVTRTMARGGGFRVVRAAIERVKEFYQHGEKAQKEKRVPR